MPAFLLSFLWFLTSLYRFLPGLNLYFLDRDRSDLLFLSFWFLLVNKSSDSKNIPPSSWIHFKYHFILILVYFWEYLFYPVKLLSKYYFLYSKLDSNIFLFHTLLLTLIKLSQGCGNSHKFLRFIHQSILI